MFPFSSEGYGGEGQSGESFDNHGYLDPSMYYVLHFVVDAFRVQIPAPKQRPPTCSEFRPPGEHNEAGCLPAPFLRLCAASPPRLLACTLLPYCPSQNVINVVCKSSRSAVPGLGDPLHHVGEKAKWPGGGEVSILIPVGFL